MDCMKGCAACCINISISSPIPGMPNGKPAGVRCIHLNQKLECDIHGIDAYPFVCREFKATSEYCGNTPEFAHKKLKELERLTSS